MTSRRSASLLKPGKAIFVFGMYFLGFSRYSKSVCSPQMMPTWSRRVEVQTHLHFGWQKCRRTLEQFPIYGQRARKDWDLACVHLPWMVGGVIGRVHLVYGVALGTASLEQLLSVLHRHGGGSRDYKRCTVGGEDQESPQKSLGALWEL